MMAMLFLSRLLVYLCAVLVPVFHPAVVVGYEATGILVWFVLVPLEMLVAWLLAPPRLSLRAWIACAVVPIVATAVLIGIDSNPWGAVLAGTLSFGLTAALFHLGPRVRPLFAVEQVALAALYLRLLAYSRASEEVAAQAAGATQLIFLLVVAAFLLHGIVVSLLLARGGYRPPDGIRGIARTDGPDRRRNLREVAVFLFIAVPILLIAAFALPPDFVEHNPIVNLLGNEARRPPEPIDEWAESLLRDGSLRGNRQPNLTGPESGSRGEGEDGGGDYSLFGIEASEWGRGREGSAEGSGEGDGDQRAVMVVASRRDPVYAADGYRDRFHITHGFTFAEGQPLNDLVRMRLAGTWLNPALPRDLLRRDFDVNVYSTVPERVLPYAPLRAEPTVYQPRYYPFSYSYHGAARVSVAGRSELARAAGLTSRNAEELAPFLEISLLPEHEAAFRAHIDEHIGETPERLYDRIIAIMESFRTFQYEIGYEDSFATGHMARFVAEVQSGDCVEFSNTAAILGRMLGVPSRVVTGYLATSSLQTPAHTRGLAVLQQSLPQLAGYSLNEMYLVTTSHRHAWVQYFLPGYGWVDFEPTSYAIPPPPGGDPNEMRVVIPLIDPRDERVSGEFPWRRVASLLMWLGIAVTTGLYLLRYGAELWFAVRARGSGRRAATARYRLLLMRMAARGYDLKPVSMTAREYGEVHPVMVRFADAYTRIRFMPPDSPSAAIAGDLSRTYRETLRSAGGRSRLSRITAAFSLRGLHYV